MSDQKLKSNGNVPLLAALVVASAMVVAGSTGYVLGWKNGSQVPGSNPQVSEGSFKVATKSAPDCPSPTSQKGGKCVLEADATLAAPLQLASDTKLDCKGHKLSPTVTGSGTTPSSPVVAVLLNNTSDAEVEKCVIEGFDFGVSIVNSKIPTKGKTKGNEIKNNTITSRFQGVNIVEADDNDIKNNDISFTADSGVGVLVFRDSDRNEVKNNTIRRTSSASTPIFAGAPLFPGGSATTLGAARGVEFNNGRDIALANFIVGSSLMQFPYDAAARLEDNTAKNNDIDMNSTAALQMTGAPAFLTPGVNVASVMGIRSGDDTESTVIGPNNEVRKTASFGIVVGGSMGMTMSPGTCSLDSTRLCTKDGHCLMAGVDTMSKGTCSGTSMSMVNAMARHVLVKDNTVNPGFADAILTCNADTTTIRGNAVSGPNRSAYALMGNSLGSAVLTRNKSSGSGRGIMVRADCPMGGLAATSFGAEVSLNDIVGSTAIAVAINANAGLITFPVELSVDGRGNHWGRTCADSDGFREFGLAGQDSPKALIIDSHPYGVPVADTPEKDLPDTCL